VVAPDVEQMIAGVITAHGRAPRVALAIHGEAGARLAIDGRPAGCAPPCTLDVAPGDHVLAIATDGFAPATRLVRVAAAQEVSLAQAPAAAALAAQQWRARRGRGLPGADAIGAKLIARFGKQRRIALLSGGARLEGALIVDGVVRARTERGPGEAPAALRELAYDASLLQRPTIFQRPWFWIALTGAAIAAGATTVWLVYQPDVMTELKP